MDWNAPPSIRYNVGIIPNPNAKLSHCIRLQQNIQDCFERIGGGTFQIKVDRYLWWVRDSRPYIEWTAIVNATDEPHFWIKWGGVNPGDFNGCLGKWWRQKEVGSGRPYMKLIASAMSVISLVHKTMHVLKESLTGRYKNRNGGALPTAIKQYIWGIQLRIGSKERG